MDRDRAVWDAHAHADPLWAVLSDPARRGHRWTVAEFMRNGEREIALLMRQLAELRIPPPQTPVLDFGCGVGRLSQALGRRFDDVTGADISPVMIALANRLNRYPDRVRYVCTAGSGIDTMPAASFGFIYSNIVLQHVEPATAVRILSELLRLLRPGGLLIFQLPSHRQTAADLEIVPMHVNGYRGSVTPAGHPPAEAVAGEEVAVPIRVRNTSAHTWSQPGAGPMAAGNHWLDASGLRMVQQDDGRAPLPQMLRAGEEARLVLRMRAPSEPGRYVVEIDLVHEGVTWFADRGNGTLRFEMQVRAGDADTRIALTELPVPDYPEDVVSPPPAGTPEPEPFAMNGVPHDQVLALIEQHGGVVRHIEEDRHAGADWISYTYFVERPENQAG